MFASLIFPALSTYYRNRLKAAYGIGIFGYAAGLTISLATDLPTGPVIVWSLAITAMLGGMLIRRSE